MKAVSFFSGGKDGLFATYLAQKNSIDVQYFLLLKTTIGLSPHYENIEALKLISDACNKKLLVFDMSNGQAKLSEFLQTLDVDMIISGDIYLESHYAWLEDLAKKSNKEFLEPLWQQNSKNLVYNMIENEFSYTIIACNKSLLSKEWLGYSFSNINDIEYFLSKNSHIDPAGESGEFHTVVTSCPLFNKRYMLKTTNLFDSPQYYYSRFFLE